MRYYLLISLAVLMFGGGFALNDTYRKLRGSDIVSSMENTLIGSVAGLIVLLCISGFDFQATPFTLLIAFIAALCSVGFLYFSFKALDRVNLSVYSLFSMLGGMVLPFLQGIMFYGEKLTLAKILCFVLISIALLLTVPGERKKGGMGYYAGIFVLNGMAGVLSKIFVSSPFEKTEEEWFSIWVAIFMILLSAGIYAVFAKKGPLPKWRPKPIAVGAGYGILNQVASFMLVLSLVHIDSSAQYPFVTGGVMIVSTAINFMGEKKPSINEIASVLVAFLGMLLLFLIPV